MNEQESIALAQFCADQYYAFDARAWLRRSKYDRNASSVAAMYLSMTSWSGHEDELGRVAADALALHASGEEFQRSAQATPFNPELFSKMVRSEIAARQVGRVPPAKAAPENRGAAL
jgi:hypothetical protein